MQDQANDPNDHGPWVDVFSGAYFGGRMYRIRARGVITPTLLDGMQTVDIRSIIVGPNTILKVNEPDQSKPIHILPKTLVPDASRLPLRKRGVQLTTEPAVRASTQSNRSVSTRT